MSEVKGKVEMNDKQKKRTEAWVHACMKTSEFSQNSYLDDEKIFSMGFDAGYLAAVEEYEGLLKECEEVLLKAWGELEAGCKVSMLVDDMIEKLRARRGEG